jgi:hypothetical protein
LVKQAASPATNNTVFKIRDSHHLVAKLIALGLTNEIIAAKTGFSIGRVKTLRDVPAMQELVAQYRSVSEAEFREEISTFYSLATANMLIAERMLNDRLVDAMDDGTAIPIKELLAVSSDRADRFGFPKTGVNVNLNADFASQLDKAIARSQLARREERETKVIEHVPSPAFVPQVREVPRHMMPLDKNRHETRPAYASALLDRRF